MPAQHGLSRLNGCGPGLPQCSKRDVHVAGLYTGTVRTMRSLIGSVGELWLNEYGVVASKPETCYAKDVIKTAPNASMLSTQHIRIDLFFSLLSNFVHKIRWTPSGMSDRN